MYRPQLIEKKPQTAFDLPIEQVMRIYASIVGRPIEKVQAYLRDVQSLDGKLPEGTFTRPLMSYEEGILEGFTGARFDKYLQILDETVRERVETQSNTGTRREVRSHCMLGQKEGGIELKTCREEAIIGTLKKMIPGFSDIFEPKRVRAHIIYDAGNIRRPR
jgi:hypothetical protein